MNAAASDVVVAGGGLVGATTALALARAGFAVQVVDAQAPGGPSDGRASSIAYAPFRMWRALGLGPALEAHAQAVRAIAVEQAPGIGRAAGSAASNRLAFSETDLDGDARAAGEPLGWLVENARAQAALATGLGEAGVEVFGISLITNLAAGISDSPLSHEEVMEAGRNAEDRLADLLSRITHRIAEDLATR